MAGGAVIPIAASRGRYRPRPPRFDHSRFRWRFDEDGPTREKIPTNAITIFNLVIRRFQRPVWGHALREFVTGVNAEFPGRRRRFRGAALHPLLPNSLFVVSDSVNPAALPCAPACANGIGKEISVAGC